MRTERPWDAVNAQDENEGLGVASPLPWWLSVPFVSLELQAHLGNLGITSDEHCAIGHRCERQSLASIQRETESGVKPMDESDILPELAHGSEIHVIAGGRVAGGFVAVHVLRVT